MKREKLLKNILSTIGIIVLIPTLAGQIGKFFGYNEVYVMIISAVILWGIYTECRIRDIQKKFFGRENGKK